MASLGAQRRLNVSPAFLAACHFNRSSLCRDACLLCTTSCAQACCHVMTRRARAFVVSRCCSKQLFCSLLQWSSLHPGQLEPTTLPQCRLAPVILSVCPFLSLSLPLKRKRGGSGRLVVLYPPWGSNPPLRDRRGVVFPLSYEEWLAASRVPIIAAPTGSYPLSGISSFAWGCVQQRVEEPYCVSGYRVCLPEERSLEQP